MAHTTRIGVTRLTLDAYFMNMLALVAGRSTCIRRSVGAIITDEKGAILSTGYNGVPRTFPHCINELCEGANDAAGDTRKCMAVHAEQNALLQCHRLDLAHTMYVSTSPCFTCAKLIANTNIQRVVVAQLYADTRGVDVLKQRVIRVEVFFPPPPPQMSDDDMQKLGRLHYERASRDPETDFD